MKDQGILFYSLLRSLAKKIVLILIILFGVYTSAISLCIVLIVVLNILSLAEPTPSNTLRNPMTLSRCVQSMIVVSIFNLALGRKTKKISLYSFNNRYYSLFEKNIVPLNEYIIHSIMHIFRSWFFHHFMHICLVTRNQALFLHLSFSL